MTEHHARVAFVVVCDACDLRVDVETLVEGARCCDEHEAVGRGAAFDVRVAEVNLFTKERVLAAFGLPPALFGSPIARCLCGLPVVLHDEQLMREHRRVFGFGGEDS